MKTNLLTILLVVALIATVIAAALWLPTPTSTVATVEFPPTVVGATSTCQVEISEVGTTTLAASSTCI